MSQENNFEEMNDQLIIRREKMQQLREQGNEPFSNGFKRTHMSQELHEAYDGLTKEELEGKNVEVAVAGRIVTKRGKGKLY